MTLSFNGADLVCTLVPQPNDFPTVPADGSYTGSVGLTYTAELDLTTGVVSEVVVTNTQHDMFCPGARMRPAVLSG